MYQWKLFGLPTDTNKMKYISKSSVPAFRYLKDIPTEIANAVQNDMKKLFYMKQPINFHKNPQAFSILKKCNGYLNYFENPVFVHECREVLTLAITLGTERSKVAAFYGRVPTKRNNLLYNEVLGAKTRTVCLRLMQMLTAGAVAQGKLFETATIGRDGEKNNDSLVTVFPKLVLIEETCYQAAEQKAKDGNLNLDGLLSLISLLPIGIGYYASVQTGRREGRWTCLIRKIVEGQVFVSVVDYFLGTYSFILKAFIDDDGERKAVLAPRYSCPVRSSETGTCSGEIGICKYFKFGDKDRNSGCMCETLPAGCAKFLYVVTVLKCLLQFIKLRRTNTRIARAKSETVSGSNRLKMPDQISVVDYYTESDCRHMKNEKFTVFSSGRTVSPHVRSGTMRHLKSGKVVPVRACIVHPEQYNGIESADRIRSTGSTSAYPHG